MTTTAPDLDKLRELDEGTRRAWMTYNERLRDLAGDEYERIESDSWSELQRELRRLEECDDLIEHRSVSSPRDIRRGGIRQPQEIV